MAVISYTDYKDLGTFAAGNSYGKKSDGYALGYHTGQDMTLKSDFIPAFASGTVYRTGYDPDGYGNYMIIKGDDGYSTLYAHMSTPSTLKKGDKVKVGDVIGLQGSSGNSSGKHLHFEVRKNPDKQSSNIDPNQYIKKMCIRDRKRANQISLVVHIVDCRDCFCVRNV